MKKTKSRKDREGCSNCFTCGWRWPTNSNEPKMCLLGIRNGQHGEELTNFPHCDRYIRDDLLKNHFEKMLQIDDKFKDDILANFVPTDLVTVTFPKYEVGDLVDYMIRCGKTRNQIRNYFGLKEV